MTCSCDPALPDPFCAEHGKPVRVYSREVIAVVLGLIVAIVLIAGTILVYRPPPPATSSDVTNVLTP